MHEKIKHLKQLEAESIYIMREVAAQFERPTSLFRREGFNHYGSTC